MGNKNQNIKLNLVLMFVVLGLGIFYVYQRNSKGEIIANESGDQSSPANEPVGEPQQTNVSGEKKSVPMRRSKSGFFSFISNSNKPVTVSSEKVNVDQSSIFAKGSVQVAVKVQMNFDVVKSVFESGSKFYLPTAEGGEVLINPTIVRENIQNSFEYFGTQENETETPEQAQNKVYLVFKDKKLIGGYLIANGVRNEFVTTAEDLYLVKPNDVALH